MTRWMLSLAVCLGIGAATTLSAQQPTNHAVAQVTTQAQAGPRVQPAPQSYQFSLPTTHGNAYAAADVNDKHTITITTLGLIGLGVLAVLLLAL